MRDTNNNGLEKSKPKVKVLFVLEFDLADGQIDPDQLYTVSLSTLYGVLIAFK